MHIRNKAALDAAIIELEKRKLLQEELLVAQYKITRESLTPMNMIKDGFSSLTKMPGIQNNLLKTAVGVGAAFLSKKLLTGNSSSLLKKALGAVVEFAVAKSAVSNADKIKAYGISVYHTLFKKKQPGEQADKKLTGLH
jgi:hypothetical protein